MQIDLSIITIMNMVILFYFISGLTWAYVHPAASTLQCPPCGIHPAASTLQCPPCSIHPAASTLQGPPCGVHPAASTLQRPPCSGPPAAATLQQRPPRHHKYMILADPAASE